MNNVKNERVKVYVMIGTLLILHPINISMFLL